MQIRTQLKLTRSDFEVLEAAKEAVIGGEDEELGQEEGLGDQEDEEEGGDEGGDGSGEEE